MKRTLSGLLLGIPVTFFIFVFMSLLVQAKVVVEPLPPTEPSTFDKVRVDTPPKPIPPITIPDKEIIKAPPTTSAEPTEEEDPKPPTLRPRRDGTDTPSIASGTDFLTGISHPTKAVRNSEAIPIIIVEPKWPTNAEVGGTVRLCFTIMPDGSAADIVVANSEPGRTFVKSARRAVYKWKFRPAYENGEPVEQKNMCYTVEYNYSLDN